MDAHMMMAELMELYGWTWQEYTHTPDFIIDFLTRKYVIDQKRNAMAMKKK